MITLQTKTPVQHLDLDNIQVGGTKNGIIRLIIEAYAIVVNKDETRVEVQFKYLDDQDRVIPNKLGSVFVLNQGVLELSQSINSSLPATDNVVDRIKEEVKLISIQKFANDFQTETTNIE